MDTESKKDKVDEQKEYFQKVHYREPGLVRSGMDVWKEWICEMQGRTAFIIWLARRKDQ